MKLRFVQPEHVIDLRRVSSLSGIRREANRLVIGAMTTHAQLAQAAEILNTVPIVAEAAGQIGDPQVRNRGTIGGSLAHADPGADLPAVMLAVDAVVTAASRTGHRNIAARDCFIDLMTSALAQGEILTEISIPIPARRTGGAYSKQPHPASRYAVIGIAATVTLATGGDTITAARVAVTGLGTKAVRAFGVEELLVGKPATAATLRAAADGIATGIPIREDAQGDATYKAHMARVHAERAIGRAVERAKAG